MRALQIETHTVVVDYGIYGKKTTKSLGLHQPLDRVQFPYRDSEQYVAAWQLYWLGRVTVCKVNHVVCGNKALTGPRLALLVFSNSVGVHVPQS